jgi:5-methylthioribose kinase
MALAGVDVLAPHLGVTRPGDGTPSLLAAAARIDEIAGAGRSVRDDLLVLFHGGPAVDAADVRHILDAATNVHGFFAASSVERLPVRAAIRDAVEGFTGIRLRGRNAPDETPAPNFLEPPPTLPLELSTETLPSYLRRTGIVGSEEPVDVEELGGGISNVILRWRTADRVGVVKQSRPRLRVAGEWLSDVRRVLNERDAIALLSARLPACSIPTVTFSDDEMLAFGMISAPDDAVLWKPELMAGRYDFDRARQAGLLLRSLHDATRDDPVAARRFVARPLLDQNRLDPWYRAAAAVHEDLRDVFEYAIERLISVRRVLVHGDFVPKNIFLLRDGLLLLDYEVVHFGNPGYDVATFVNHMLLKGFRHPSLRRPFCRLAELFWDAYVGGLERAELELVGEESLLQLGALMLARVDGKSKVEYLVGSPGADDARAFGRWLLRSRPASLAEVFGNYMAGMPAHEEVGIT